MLGILLGMRKYNWSKVPLVIMETEGANSFNQAVLAKKVVALESIASVATSLGSLSIQKELLEMSLSGEFDIISGVVSDRSAINACLQFANDHRMLVEPACGAGLSSIYSDTFINTNSPLDSIKDDNQKPIVLIVCGGEIVSTELLQKWKTQFAL